MEMPSVDRAQSKKRTEEPTSIRWSMATCLLGFALVSYLARANISFAAETMMPALGLTKVQMGQIFTGFLIGYALFQVPGGDLGDKIGPRRTLTISALIWAVATVLTGLSPHLVGGSLIAGFSVLWIVRFALGLAEATTFPVGNRVLRNWMAPSERALGGSIMFMGTSIASAITAPLVPWLISKVGWQRSFYLDSLPAVLMALIWHVWTRDAPAKHPRVNSAELALIRNEDVPEDAEPSAAVPLRALLKQRNIRLLILSYFSEGYVLFFFVFWLHVYLVEQRHFSIMGGGWVAALPWLTALVLTPFGGLLCDRVAGKYGRIAGARVVLLLGYGVTGAMLFLAAYASSAVISVGALALSIAFLMASETAFWSAATHMAGQRVGSVSGVMNTAGIFGGIVSTSLVPVLVEHFGWLTALSSGSVIALACVLVWIVIKEETPDERVRSLNSGNSARSDVGSPVQEVL